jgi:hypothetical protein
MVKIIVKYFFPSIVFSPSKKEKSLTIGCGIKEHREKNSILR